MTMKAGVGSEATIPEDIMEEAAFGLAISNNLDLQAWHMSEKIFQYYLTHTLFPYRCTTGSYQVLAFTFY